MIFRRKIRSLLLGLMFRPGVIRMNRWLAEKHRQLTGRKHVVSVFLQLDDPYSYILSHYLPSFAASYDIELRLYLSEALGDEYQPAPEMLAEYAVTDCTRLALELGISFLDKGSLPPTEHRVGLTNAVASAAGSATFDEDLRRALAIFWRGNTAAAANMSQAPESRHRADTIIAESQALLKKLGHYNSAMLHYAGEWYWGVDRLHYLLERLDRLGVTKASGPDPQLASIKQTMKASLPVKPPAAAKDLPPIEFFHSFRSPYSYLGLQRTCAVADAFGLEVKFRPVLPMVQSGMKVPRAKLLYIVKDAEREARRRNIPFGKIADPVGPGALRCLAVYCYAESERRARDFLLNAGNAIWAEGIDVASDKGMRKVTGRSGLFWPGVKAAMQNEDWREEIEGNRESMMSSGSWGVPTVRMGDFIVWGQDRDWMLARHIEELCDKGDGIIV
ncbi:MAG: DsbA family protein [Gammaproteobacteria bacterium]|nr:DsbA family protein [Gammaproteobacteria bacterium]MDH5261947.1 DsbA family protein [Gammaproteobacteria bacterium]MDH5583924.1 DsbA family protein [Gammaproteobacteria bacterium]